jgi:sigma-B regulation protein RsbU (phosphoserine phosphatase)
MGLTYSNFMQGTILIIDDIQENIDLLSRYLEREGHTVVQALSASAAFSLMEEHGFDIIMCDLMMPEVDGMAFLHKTKGLAKYQDIPILMISALDEVEAVAEAIEAGAEDYLLKPFNRTLLRARIHACLEKKTWRDREKHYLQLLRNDLSAAAQLQESVLPQAFGFHPQADLVAFIKPAAEVGGDFYDYFWISPTQLAVLVADVSGKGLTGAFFMAMARTLIKAYARFHPDPCKCLEIVNAILAENNEQMMFVTLFYAIWDLSTHQLTYINAGHCPAILLKEAGSYELLDRHGGLPLGVTNNAQYHSDIADFPPMSQLILYTDGINEAMDDQGNQYGYTRLYELCQKWRKEPLEDKINTIIQAVRAFAGEAEQSDDITCLILAHKHNLDMVTLEMAPNIKKITEITEKIKKIFRGWNVAEDQLYYVDLALDELLSNIIFYGKIYEKKSYISITLINFPEGVALEIVDEGIPFDPTQRPNVDITKMIENRDIGGLGIHFVKTFTAKMRYHHETGRNHVVIEFDKQP